MQDNNSIPTQTFTEETPLDSSYPAYDGDVQKAESLLKQVGDSNPEPVIYNPGKSNNFLFGKSVGQIFGISAILLGAIIGVAIAGVLHSTSGNSGKSGDGQAVLASAGQSKQKDEQQQIINNSILEINRSTVVNKSFVANGDVLVQSNQDSANAFKIQSSNGNNILVADTLGKKITVGDQPPGNVSLAVNGDITVNGNLVSTTQGYSLSDQGLTIGGVLVCTANGCISSNSPPPTPASPTIDVANLMYLNTNQTISGTKTFSSTTTFNAKVTVNAPLQVAGNVNSTVGFSVNGTAGANFSCPSGQLLQQAVISGGIITSGSCVAGAGASVATLQEVYDASSPANIVLSPAGGPINIQDAASPLATNLFEVANNGGSTLYFAVNSLGITVTGNVNTTGQYQVGGVQISSANLSNDANLAKVNGNTTFTGNNTFSSASNSFTGNGAGLTNVNAAQLNGQNGAFYQNAGNINAGTLNDARLSNNVALLNTLQTFTGANTFSNASNSFTGNGSGLTSLNASNISSGTLNDLRLSPNVTLAGNTFNGANQLVQLTAGGILPVLNGSNLTALNASNISSGTLNDARLSANVALLNANNIFLGNNSFHLNSTALTVQDAVSPLAGNLFEVTDNAGTTKYFEVSSSGAKVGGNDVCTSAGNCVGTGGGGAIGGGGTAGKLAVFTGSGFTIGDSLLSQSGGTVTVGGNINLTSGNTYEINGSQISSANLSNDANLAKLNGNQTFTGTNTFSNASNSFTGDGAGLSNVDAAKLGGQLPGYYTNASNIASGTLNDARLSSSVALKNGNNTFTGNNVFSLNTAGLAVQDAASPLGTNLFEITDNTGATKYFTVSATALQFLGNDVCTTAGNCSGVGGGVTTPGGTAGKLAKFTASGTIGDSLVSESGGTVTVGGVLAVNTITPTASLTVGTPTQTLALQGDGSTSLSATVSGIKNSLVFAAPTVSNKTITIPNASGTVAVSASGPLSLDAAGNLTCPTCLTGGGGGGSGVSSVNTLSGDIVLAGTPNQVIITPSGNTLTFSLPQSIDTSSTPDFAGIDIGGSQISSAALSNDANLAKLNGTQTFTGANTFSNAGNSFTGDGSGLTNLNASNVATGTLNDGRLSSNVALLNRMGQVFTGDNTVKVNSANAFQVQNVNGENVMSIDTTSSNLITNSNFETGTTGWQAVGSAVVSSNSSHWVYGGKSLQFVTSAGDTGVKFPVALSSSTSYTLSFYAESLSTGQNIKAGRADDGSTNTQCLFSANAFIYWNRYSCTFTTGTTSGSPYIYILSNLVNTTVIDGVMLQTGSTLNPYSVGKINTAGVFTSPIVIQGSEASGGSAANYFQVVNNDGTTAFSVDDNGNGGSKIITSSITIGGPNSTLNVTISLPTNHILQTDAYNNLFGTPAGAAGLGRVDLTPRTSGDVGEVIRGTSGQSVDLLRLQDSNGNIQSGFDMNGQIFLGKASTQTGNITLYNSGGSGSVVLDTNNPGSSNYTLHLPAENGTICTTAATSACNSAGGLSNVAYLNANQTFTGNNTFSSASNSFTGDGSGLTNLNASNVSSGTLNDGRLSSNVALLNRSGQIFTGDNTVKVNSANAFQVQNAGGNNILSVDTSANNVGLGKASTITGNLQFYNSAGTGVINLQSANTGSSNFTITLPAASGNVCLDSGNCVGTGGGGSIGGGGTANKIALFTGTGYTIGDSQLSQTGGTVTNSGNEVVNGTVLAKNTVNSTAAFQVQNAAGDAIFNVNTTDANNNLLSNPSGEQTLSSSNWQAKGGSAVSQDSTASWIGNNSVKTVTTATVGDGVKQNITLTNNTQYTFSAYFEASGTGITNLTPGYFDGTTENDCALSPASSNIGASQWRRFSCTFTTPASHSGTPYIYVKQSDAAVKTVWMDAIQLVTGASNPVFQEGSISLNGLVTSPVVIKVPGNTTGSVSGTTSPFAVLDQSGNQVLALDVANNAGTLLLANGNLQVGNTFGVRSSGTGASLHFESDGSVYVDSSTATAGANKNTILKTGGSILLQNASSTLATVSNTGATTFQNSSNSANAFQVQNSSGTNLLNVDSTNSRVSVDVTLAAMSAPTQNNTSTSTTGGTLAATTYYYKITAVDGAGGETLPSNEKSQVTTGSTSTVTLSWSAVTGSQGYKVYRGTTALGGAGSEVFLTYANNNSYIDTGSITAGTATPPATGTAYTSTNYSNNSLQLTVGGLGRPTGQLYVSGVLPATQVGSVAAGVAGINSGKVQGKYLYVVGSGKFLIFDVSVPTNMSLVSSTTIANIGSFDISGHYAYMWRGTSGLSIYDISNPSSPALAGLLAINFGSCNNRQDIVTKGRYVFVWDCSPGSGIPATIDTIDVSNASNPYVVGRAASVMTLGSYVDLAMNDRYLVVSNLGTTAGPTEIYDTSNPASLIRTVSTSTNVPQTQGNAVQGKYVFLKQGNLGIAVSSYDISNPSSLTFLQNVNDSDNTNGGQSRMFIQGRYLYVGMAYGISDGLEIMDISNPANMIHLGKTAFSGQFMGVNGRYAFFLDSANNLVSYDLGGAYIQQLEAGGITTDTLGVSGKAGFAQDVSVQGALGIGSSLQVSGNTGLGGGLNVQGSSVLGGGLNQLATPSAPTVTPQGTTGAQRWDYTITAINAYGGETLASTAGTTATGNATLTGTNFNRVTWSAVSGATSYKIYRTFTTGATSPTTTGLVGSTTALTFDDTGFAAAGSAPTVNTTGQLIVTGSSVFQNATNSTTAFQIQNAAGTSNLLIADTTNSKIGLGLAPSSTGAILQAGGATPGSDTQYIQVTNTTNSKTVGLAEFSDGTVGIGASDRLILRSVQSSNGIQLQPGTSTTFKFNSTGINAGQFSVQGSSSILTIGEASASQTIIIPADAAFQALGTSLFKDNTNSATAFQVQDNGSAAVLTADTSNKYVQVGSATTDATAVLNVLDSYNNGTDPTGVNGAMYYNTSLNAFRCYQNGTWINCAGTGATGTTSQTKVVSMGSPVGCTGSVPVASLDTNADYVVNSCTSAQTTINTAITALGSTGGTVYLKEGTYIVDGQINLASNVSLVGASQGTILKIKDSIASSFNVVNASSASRIGLKNLILDGNKANWTSGTIKGVNLNTVGSGSGTSAVLGIAISNVQVRNFHNEGVYFTTTKNSSISDSMIVNNGSDGILTLDSGDNTISVSSSQISGNGGKGINLFDGSYFNISDNIVEGNTSDGIGGFGGSKSSISGNTVKANGGDGFNFVNSGASGITFNDNAVSGNTGIGILMNNNPNNTISGNAVTGNGSYGIQIFSNGATGNSITGNTVASNSNNGIYLASGATFNNVSGNQVASNTGVGVYVLGDNNTVSSNYIAGNSQDGIYINTSSGSKIDGNTVYNNGGSGSSNGIEIQFGNSANEITSNKINDTAGTGNAIKIGGGVSSTLLSGNTYSGTGATSISDSGTGTIYSNQARSTNGDSSFRNGTNSSAAFQVQSASGSETLLTADTTARSASGGNLIKIGNSTGTDVDTTILVVDSAATAPTSNLGALNGGLFYNSGTNHIDVIENGAVKELCNKTDLGCGSASTPTLAQVYGYGANTSDSVLSLDTTRGGVIVKDSSGGIGGTLFGVQSNTGTKYLDVTNAGISTTNLSVAAGGYISIAGGNTASRPGSPTEGMLYYDTTTKSLLVYANGKWQADRSSSSKLVGMGTATGCTGSSPVASLNADAADYVVTSCTSAQTTINTAITALGSTGGTVYLMEGTYIIDGTINLASNVTLAGAGAGTILKLKDSINAGIDLFTLSSINRVTVKDLRLDGNRTNNTSGTQNAFNISSVGSGTGTSAVPGLSASDITVQNFRSDAFSISSITNSVISNSNLINNGSRGIEFKFSGGTNDSYLRINGNTIQGSGDRGIWGDITGNPSYVTIDDNIIESNTGAGVYLSGNSNTISGNVFRSNGNKGIQLFGSNNTVSSNNFVSNTGSGVYVRGGGNAISSNTMTSNTGNGVEIDSASSGQNAVTGNKINSNGSSGIYAGGSNNSITGNDVMSNTGHGIEVVSSSNNVTGNAVASNTSDGIHIGCCSNVNNIVSGNQVSSNSGSGITVDASDTTKINDNWIYNNGGSGSTSSILIFANAFHTPDKNIITNNTIVDTAGTGYAIELSGGLKPTNTYISGNSYSGTGATSFLTTGTTGTTYINQSQTATSDYLYRFGTDSATAFQVQSAGGSESLLSIDTTARSASGGNLIKIGNSTGNDTATTILVLDSAASAPTSNLGALNGGLFYNSGTGHINIIEGGVVKELCNKTDLGCGTGSTPTLAQVYSYGAGTSDSTIALDSTRGGIVIKDSSTPISGSLFSVQNNSGGKFLDVTSSTITLGENTVANAAVTATTATTSGTGTNTTTVALTAVNSLANGDVIFIDNAGQDYYTRITAGGGTTSLTVDPAVTFENARTVTKYSVQYLGSDGTNFSGATRNQNSFYQGYFLGGVVTGAGSTVYSDANISSVGNLQINTATGVNIKGTNSTTAFQVQNAAGTSLLNLDSTNMKLTLSQSNFYVTDLSAPTSPAVAAGANTGGTLSGAAGTTYYYKITALSGTGESLGSSEVSINGQGFTKLSTPGAATVGAPSAGGSVTLGTHSYKVTFVTANGETTGGTTSSQVNVTTGGTQTVPLTAIPLGATGTTARKIYRTVSGDTGNYLLLTTLNNNTTTTFNDTVADASLGAAAPASNTATTSTNNATVTWTAVAGATGYRVYRGTAVGAESAYQAAASSPFTDTGAAGTAGTVHTYSTVDAVGIGTSTPGASLDVEGTALFKNGANSTSAFQIQDSSGTSVLNADTNNRLIGINNSAPTATLDVIASAVSYAEGFESGTTGSFSGALWTASTTNPHTGSYSIGATTGGIGTLSVTKSMTTAGTVSFWANVQSGCCATPSTFKIDGVTQQSWSPNTTTPWTFYSFAVTSGSHTYSWAFNNTQPAYFYMDDFKLTMSTGSAYAAAFNSGNVGIGTSAPGSTLEVDGTATFKLPTTASAFQVQNTIGSQILTVDPTNNSVSIAQGNLTVSGLTNITSVPTLTSSGTGGTLAAGTYYYQVAAVNANGTTPAIATNPTSVTTSGSTSQNTITWSAKTNASGYNVYRSTNGTNWFVNTVSAAATTLVDNGSTYTWTSAIGPPTTNTTGGNLTVKGAATFTNASNSTSALDVQDATGDSILRVDSTDRHVGINNSAPVAALDVVASPPAPDFTWGFEDGTYGALSHSGGNKISPAGAHTGSYGWWGDTCGNPSDTMTLTRSLGSAGYISFWAYLHGFWGGWNVFWIDGVAKITLPGGTIPYAQYTYPLSAGTHTFQWNTGDTCDAIYVDDITVGTNAPNSNAAVFNGGNVGIGTVAPSATLETDGTSIFKATSNVTSTFQIQNATGDSLFNADTTNTQITIGRFVDGSLSAPASPGAAAGANTGGTLSGAAGTTYYYKVSAMTVDGETPLSSEVSINGQSFTKLTAPGAATVGAPAAGGSVDLGLHSYKVTFVTANGETTGGTTSSQVNVTTGGTQTVPLTAIPTGPAGTTQRKVYRTVAGDTGSYLLLTTIANNTTTTYNDTTADGSLGAAAPVSNTATTSTNNATISWSAVTGATSYRVYRGTASGAETAYQTAASSPFTDTGAAGTSLANTSLAVKGTTSVQNVVDSTTAFQIQNAAGASMFTVDTTNSKITLGTASATPVLLVLGTKNTSGDPTCVNGAMYYNSNTSQFRFCQGGSWTGIGSSAPSYVTSLPGSPSNGQEIYYNVGSGVSWHLRYNSTNSNWEYLGGGSSFVNVGSTSSASGSGVWEDKGTQYTFPLAGKYMVRLLGRSGGNGSGTTSYISVGIGTQSITVNLPWNDGTNGIDQDYITAASAGSALHLYHQDGDSTRRITANNVSIEVIPLTVN